MYGQWISTFEILLNKRLGSASCPLCRELENYLDCYSSLVQAESTCFIFYNLFVYTKLLWTLWVNFSPGPLLSKERTMYTQYGSKITLFVGIAGNKARNVGHIISRINMIMFQQCDENKEWRTKNDGSVERSCNKNVESFYLVFGLKHIWLKRTEL